MKRKSPDKLQEGHTEKSTQVIDEFISGDSFFTHTFPTQNNAISKKSLKQYGVFVKEHLLLLDV